MTIAIGLACKDGVVLCSDTQITEAVGKSYESKIFCIDDEADCHLAYAGSTELIKEFVSEMRRLVKTEDRSKLARIIKRHYIRFHDKHFTKAPKAERAYVSIIVAIREGAKIVLYAGNGRMFYPIENKVCFGSGAPVVEPFFGATQFPELFTDNAARLAIYALWRIKDFAEGVGGKTKVVRIEDDSFFDPPSCSSYELKDATIKESERAYKYLDKHMRPLLLDYPLLPPEQVFKLCRSIGNDLKKFRAIQMKEQLRRIKAHLSESD